LPANRHSYSDNPLPSVVVVDSSFVFEALIDSGKGRYIDARAFAERIRIANTILVYSSLIFLEAPQCWRRLYKGGALVPNQRGLDEVSDRRNAFVEADRQLGTFLAAFNTRRVSVDRRIMKLGSEMAATYNLSSHDALVVAISWDTGIADIAALDDDFEAVDGIELWDNLF
jgi:predicted nucleic acid-binding protein